MNKHIQLSKIIGITSGAYLLVASMAPAVASPSFLNTVQNLLGVPNNNPYVDNYASNNNYRYQGQGKLAANQAIIQNNLITRGSQLRTQIDASVSNGQLAPQTAADLRAQVDQVEAMRNAYDAGRGGLTNDQTQQLVDAFTNITLQLDNSTSADAEYGAYGTPQYNYNYAFLQGNLNTREAQLQTQIDAAYREGRLSKELSDEYRGQMEQARTRQNEYAKARNGITKEQNQELLNTLSGITTHMNAATLAKNAPAWHNRGNLAIDQSLVQGNLTARQGHLRTQVEANAASGRFSNQEAEARRSQLDQVAAKQASLVNSQGGLTDGQYRQLVDKLGNIDVRRTHAPAVANTEHARNFDEADHHQVTATEQSARHHQ